MKIIYFVDFHLTVQIFPRHLIRIAEKRVGIIIKKKKIYFFKTKNVPIAKRMRKCVVRLSK